ncbi:MAG: hypothetical protein HZB38_01580 [Planctomycetes bacterium]|nr:hypothetical protein [Planctomycetota bacterium]
MPVVTVHKIASATCGHIPTHEVEINEGGAVRVGDVIVVKALEEKRVYDQLELVGGRQAHISKDDILVGVLGSRQALRGFVGHCPTSVSTGDTLSVLNLGGVVGIATSGNEDLGGQPLKVKVLGLAVRDGKVINIAENAVPTSKSLKCKTPLIVVSGTCMSAGKTRAVCEIIAQLNQRGFRFGAMKLSGVAAMRDTLNMQDHGAVRTLSFLDAGYPSTAGFDDLAPMAIGLLNHMSRESDAGKSPLDAIVVEMGDGILGGYGVGSFFRNEQIRGAIAVHVMCAGDLVGAWGAKQLAESLGRKIDVMSGPATDNEVGEKFIEKELSLPAANARTAGRQLADIVAMRAFGRESKR